MNQMGRFFGGGGNGGGFRNPFGNMIEILNKFRTFMQNPISAMMSSGMDIPQNIANNPDAILNYMRYSGRMTDDQYSQAAQAASDFRKFMPKGF